MSFSSVGHKVGFRIVLIALALLGLVLVQNDDALYRTTIVQVTDVQTRFLHTEVTEFALENYYLQTLTCVVKNGEQAGETVTLTNQYSDSGIRDEQYRKGNRLLVSLGKQDGKIYGQKRDTYIYLIAALLILSMLFVAGKSGMLAFLSVLINMGLLVIALDCYLDGWNILGVTAGMLLLFAICSLFISNGWNRRSFLAIAATLLSILVTGILYLIVRACTGELQYQLLEYAVVPDDLSSLFLCEVMVGSLGAVMDVAISIVSTVDELLHSNPNISPKALLRSIREVGFDIMGTMVNVLFFTYLCGGLPMVLIMLKNNLPLTLLWEYELTFEIVRFLVGAIGIVLTVPIAEGVSMLFLRKRGARADG